MDEPVLIELFCGACRSRFYVCERDFRGHRYCQDVCRGRGQRKARQAANARHQRSTDGRADHRDRNRAWRKRKSAATCVTDKGSKKLACVAPLPTPDRLPVAMEVAVQSDGAGKNDEAIQVDSVDGAKPHAAVVVGRDGRDPQSGSTARYVATTPPRDDDNDRGLVDVVGCKAVCCCVCGRAGRLTLPVFRGRSGRRGPQRAFRGRDRPTAAAARTAN